MPQDAARRLGARTPALALRVPLAVSAAVFLMVDMTYGRTGGLVAGLGTMAAAIVFWWLIPISGRRPAGERHTEG